MKITVRIYSNWSNGFTFDFVEYKIQKTDPDEFLKDNDVFEIYNAIYFISKKSSEIRFETKIKN